ncbi:MAG TPA: hypothetical protein VK306_05385 [Acidimicrobiales bacterium]|nr:hypothetical protein [Acidimicrobiales bacterium]
MAYEPGRSDTSPLGGPAAHVEGVDKRQLTRLVVAGVALLAAAIFILQNNERVETTFLVFSVRTRLWVGLVVALLLGALLGQAVEAVVNRRRRRAADD